MRLFFFDGKGKKYTTSVYFQDRCHIITLPQGYHRALQTLASKGNEVDECTRYSWDTPKRPTLIPCGCVIQVAQTSSPKLSNCTLSIYRILNNARHVATHATGTRASAHMAMGRKKKKAKCENQIRESRRGFNRLKSGSGRVSDFISIDLPFKPTSTSWSLL